MPTTFAFPDEKDSEEEKHSGEKSRFVKGQDFEVNSADDDHNENYYEDRAFNYIYKYNILGDIKNTYWRKVDQLCSQWKLLWR